MRKTCSDNVGAEAQYLYQKVGSSVFAANNRRVNLR